MAKKSKEREKDELISSLVSNKRRKAKRDTTNSDVCFFGNPLSAAEARRRWPHRYQSKGDIDIICGGPPCQGVSGFNRFRNKEAPLDDVKNHQLLVFMDIIDYLKPRYVLMENIVDILKFAGGFLGRYAKARLGMMAAGSYGLPQFRMRDIHVRSDNDDSCMMQEALCLEDAISDLPPVHVVSYMADVQSVPQPSMLYDHRPYKLNKDDLYRVCLIPKKKGANFRNLRGVLVGQDKKVECDSSIPREMLPSGKPLVPEYAMTYVKGKSKKPFGRLWWDEIVPTVVTRAEPHNQAILHPVQDRVLTIRENARLQGFPDCYQIYGPFKERYVQVGNTVAIPVALALGYTFGLACQGLSDDRPVTTLPLKFPKCLARSSSAQT
ncbi:dna (cytosine-5)-methyltransferase 3 [Quercus suber]|uniref:DNA (cytosine-5-)-methyltransferase n=1 Tax=Quercus suber TaxID=58331 RepID=A0AAW0LW85_QUESU